MPHDTHDLAERLAALCRELRDLDHDTVDTACMFAADILSEDGGATAQADDAVLDGLRWGHRAAHIVARKGGTILRLLAPGGSYVTHEFRAPVSDAHAAMVLRGVENLITEHLSEQAEAEA